MLVLTRKKNDTIVIDGRITVEVLQVKGGGIRLGITAPADVSILRGELKPFGVEGDGRRPNEYANEYAREYVSDSLRETLTQIDSTLTQNGNSLRTPSSEISELPAEKEMTKEMTSDNRPTPARTNPARPTQARPATEAHPLTHEPLANLPSAHDPLRQALARDPSRPNSPAAKRSRIPAIFDRRWKSA